MFITHHQVKKSKVDNGLVLRLEKEYCDRIEIADLQQVRELYLTDCQMKVLLLVAGATEKIYLKNCVIQDLNIQQQGQLRRLNMIGV